MAISWRAAVLVAVGAIAVVLIPSTAIAWGWVGLVAVLCLLDTVVAVSPRDLELTREVGGPVRADETTQSVVTVHNPTRRRIHLDVRDAWPPSLHPAPRRHAVSIAGHGSFRVITHLYPERRGTRQADYITVRVWGPLGLAARQVSIGAPLNLSVLPEFRSRRLLPSRLARLHELEGATATTLRGPGTEFDSLREYVEGDDPRDIDWRASARSRDLVVRTWRPERDRHVVLVLDAGRTSALLLGSAGEADATGTTGTPGAGTGTMTGSPASTPDPDDLRLGVAPRLDAGIEASLLLAALADRAGDNVHLVALDRSVRARVSGVRGAELMRRIAESLVDVAPGLQPIDWRLVVSEVARTAAHSSLVVLLTEVPPVGADPDFLEAVTELAARHVVIAASARDPELARLAGARDDVGDVYGSAAASSVLREAEAGDEDARRAGAVVLDVEAGLLAARLSDLYVELKKQGKL